ncbi:MAG: efflux RND transporter periplasmic adaptor subunit [Bacteroidetes bacterium]|nr:efflux RND transporter periplasmic adaptor subunit [Bacteroidota bacterium]
MKTSAYVLLLFGTLALSMCGKKNEHAQHDATKYTCPMHPQVIQDKPGSCPICGMDLVKMDATAGADGSIMLNESQIKLANITTTLTRFENMGENTILTGKLMVNEEQTEVVSSRVQGRIEKLYLKEIGQRVTQGQALYEIYSEQLLILQQEYLLALRQFDELKEPRYESFLKASEKKLVLFGMTKEQVSQLALRKKTDSRITFVAHVSGVVARIDATEGQYVSEGSALYRIERLDQVWAEAELYTGESSLVKTGDIVRVKISGFENETVVGKVTFLSPEYRQGSQIITLRAQINNSKKEFLPGMQATVILSHSEKKAIALPVDAVIRDGKGSHVWILEKDGAFKPRMVQTGLENFEKVEITEGIEEKENVVITGAYLLYGELVLKKGGDLSAGHHHH